MKIQINGTHTTTSCATLAELLESLDHAEDTVATAVNGNFVAAAKRTDYHLQEADTVEIIAPMAGG